MAIGKSHRIVIEVDPAFKEQIYAALNARGLTLKSWFTEQALADLVKDAGKPANPNKQKAK